MKTCGLGGHEPEYQSYSRKKFEAKKKCLKGKKYRVFDNLLSLYQNIIILFLYNYRIEVSDYGVLTNTFNNISVISWRSVLMVGETGMPGENHRPVASH